jgi:hypothetical protein
MIMNIKKILTVMLVFALLSPLGFFTVKAADGKPSISFSYSLQTKTLMIIATDPGYQYSSSTQIDGANLIIQKEGGIDYYVLDSLTIDTSGSLSTKEIQLGDQITGFSPGNYFIKWRPTGDTIFTFTATPSIVFSYDDQTNILTITSADPGYQYSKTSTWDGVQLDFTKDGTSKYVMDDMTIGYYGTLSTKTIQAGDTITGFAPGTYFVNWYPFAQELWSFVVSTNHAAPTTFESGYSPQYKTFRIINVNPGYQYSSSSQISGANLVFEKDGVTYYVLDSLTLGTSGTLSTKAIQIGDEITGFSAGTYKVRWHPTNQNLWTFTAVPSIFLTYDDQTKIFTITTVDPGLQYSTSSTPAGKQLVFVKDGIEYYILEDMTVGRTGTLSTKSIQAGDTITGFPPGTYMAYWYPDATNLWGFVVGAEHPFEILAPRGSQTYSGTINVQWTNLYQYSDSPSTILFTSEYKTTTGTIWNKITDVFTTSYNWDTTKVPNGVYTLRVSYVLNGARYSASTNDDITISNQINEFKQAQIYGRVEKKTITVPGESSDPLANATVGLMKVTNPNITTGVWVETFTDQNGRYLFSTLTSGWYHIRASKEGYDTVMTTIELTENQVYEQNFQLPKSLNTTTPPFYHGNKTLLIEGWQMGRMGGSIAVWKDSATASIDQEISVYTNSFEFSTIDTSKDTLSFVVNSEEHDGKIIVVDVDASVLDPKGNFVIKCDGVPITMADNITDLLNFNQPTAEYLISVGAKGVELLIRIPHFSAHGITISSVVELVGGIYAVILYISVFAILAVFYVTSFFVARGRKRK